ncbi:hypothetical protein GJ496_004005 [Pomphorhynchus laevis]|nr:hypothetical protein GJ496_004005 [Pomphorhynchus laevis]
MSSTRSLPCTSTAITYHQRMSPFDRREFVPIKLPEWLHHLRSHTTDSNNALCESTLEELLCPQPIDYHCINASNEDQLVFDTTAKLMFTQTGHTQALDDNVKSLGICETTNAFIVHSKEVQHV